MFSSLSSGAGSAGGAGAGPSRPPAAQLAQEARLSRALQRQRCQQYAKAAAEASAAQAEADGAERSLVFALDRAAFASAQLSCLAAEDLPIQRVLQEHLAEFEAVEELARRHEALLAELGERRRRAAAAVARLRLLRALCGLSGSSGVACGLASLLWRCEEALLTESGRAAGASPRPPLEVLAAELEATSPFSLALPLLQPSASKQPREREGNRWLLSPALKPGIGEREEDAELRKASEDLMERQRLLRTELDEVRENGRKQEAAAASAREDRRRQWAEAAELRRELADCYERLAEDDGALEEELTRLRAAYDSARAERSLLEASVPQTIASLQDVASHPRKSSRGRIQTAESEPSSAPSRPSSGSVKGSCKGSPSSSPHGSPRASGGRQPKAPQQFTRLKSAEFAALQRHGSATLKRISPRPNEPSESGGANAGANANAAAKSPAAAPSRLISKASPVKVEVSPLPASRSTRAASDGGGGVLRPLAAGHRRV